ncbi:MAG: hypothetical protein J7647_03085 [Cyanobacteria bacterium SBLK]|nr:hypothetical protein [Cyanobacteria bacterium SBLK]
MLVTIVNPTAKVNECISVLQKYDLAEILYPPPVPFPLPFPLVRGCFAF